MVLVTWLLLLRYTFFILVLSKFSCVSEFFSYDFFYKNLTRRIQVIQLVLVFMAKSSAWEILEILLVLGRFWYFERFNSKLLAGGEFPLSYLLDLLIYWLNDLTFCYDMRVRTNIKKGVSRLLPFPLHAHLLILI